MHKSPRRAKTLWGHVDFMRLWGGQTVALFGEQVTLLALPLTAIQLLNASASQVGLLNALSYLPVIFVTLLAGVLADRLRRRRLLIAANVGRIVILALVPIFAWAGHLSIGLLFVVAFGTGLFTAQFDVAYQAYLPTLIDKRFLVEGNSKLQASQSFAQTAGQGLSGVLVQVFTAPTAILFNSVGYLVSVVSLLSIQTTEKVRITPRRRIRAEIVEGLRVTLGYPVLRVLVAQSAWFNLLCDVVVVVVPIYGIRVLHLGPARLGLVIAAGSIGAFGGAVLARAIGRRLGISRAMATGMLLACVAWIGLPTATGPTWAIVAELFASYVVNGFGITLFNVHSVALRQSLVPIELIGRVSASYRFVSFAAIPIGGFLGGVLAGWLGSRNALTIAVIGLVAGALVFFASRAVREADLE